jgi:ferredoxin
MSRTRPALKSARWTASTKVNARSTSTPDECVDCGACEPVCPVEAIYYEDDTPSSGPSTTRPTSSSSTTWVSRRSRQGRQHRQGPPDHRGLPPPEPARMTAGADRAFAEPSDYPWSPGPLQRTGIEASGRVVNLPSARRSTHPELIRRLPAPPTPGYPHDARHGGAAGASAPGSTGAGVPGLDRGPSCHVRFEGTRRVASNPARARPGRRRRAPPVPTPPTTSARSSRASRRRRFSLAS